jgi:phosphate transport system protein
VIDHHYSKKHINIVTPLKSCLTQLEQNVLRMASLVEYSFRLSHQCVFDGNLDATEQIKK